MGRKNRSPEENERRAKIRELLQARNISSMDDIQNLFKETIAEFMEIRKNEPFYLLGKRLISVTVGFDGVPCVDDFLHIQFLSHNSCSVLWLRFCFSAAGCA